MTTTRLVSAALAAVLSVSAPGTAQTPSNWDGWYAVCSADTTYRNLGRGPGGIFMVHPTKGTVIPIKGLPAALTGVGVADPQGARCLAHDPVTGHLWVGEALDAGSPVALFEIELRGAVGRVVRAVTAGQSNGGNQYSAVHGLTRHPDGRIFAVRNNITKGPLGGFPLAVFDPKTNTFTGLRPTPQVIGIHDKLVLSHDGNTLYYGSWTNTQSSITALDLASMRQACGPPIRAGENRAVAAERTVAHPAVVAMQHPDRRAVAAAPQTRRPVLGRGQDALAIRGERGMDDRFAVRQRRGRGRAVRVPEASRGEGRAGGLDHIRGEGEDALPVEGEHGADLVVAGTPLTDALAVDAESSREAVRAPGEDHRVPRCEHGALQWRRVLEVAKPLAAGRPQLGAPVLGRREDEALVR